MRLLIMSAVLCLMPVGIAFAADADTNALQSVEVSKDNGYFVTTYKFMNAVNPESVSLEVQTNGVQVRFPGTHMFTDQNLVHVGNNGIKSIYTVQESQGQIRSRVIFDHDQKKSDTTDSVRVIGNGNSIQIVVKNPNEAWKSATIASDDIAPQSLELDAKKIIVAEVPAIAEKFVADKPIADKIVADKPGKANAPKEAIAKKILAENEIPVLNSVSAKKENIGSPWGRFVMSILVIAVLCGGLVVFSKWYAKNNKGVAANNKIRMLTQFHLGPKKSLAIVQVAGEAILIGVTDHNISMIKSLSLLDDEMPEAARGGEFLETLDRSPGHTPARVQSNFEDEFIVSSIKDKITTKLKGLRQL